MLYESNSRILGGKCQGGIRLGQTIKQTRFFAMRFCLFVCHGLIPSSDVDKRQDL